MLQSETNSGSRGYAATFRRANGAQHRLQLDGQTDVPLNEWTHVVFTMEGSVGRIYFDGVQIGERLDFPIGIGDIDAGGTTENFVGHTSWPDPVFDGLIDDVRMYGYELSAEDVAELAEGPPVDTAPVASDDRYTTDAGADLVVDAPGVLANDT